MKKPTKEQLLSDVLSDLTWKEIANKYDYTDSRFLRKLAVRYDLPPRRKILKPTKEELEKLLFIDNLSINEITSKLGYADNGWSLIYSYCREYGIKFDLRPNHELREIPFTNEQKSIVYGTLLGDGYLRPTGNNYALSLTHGEKQIEYLKWKFSKLNNFITQNSFYKSEHEFKGNMPTYSANTISHPFLTEVRSLCYPNNIKRVTSEWLSNIDNLALAVWYLDDGSLNKRYKTIVLCTNCFSYEEHELIQNWFLNKYSIPTVIEKRRNNQFCIIINASYSMKFRNIIREFVPKCMSYKLGD